MPVKPDVAQLTTITADLEEEWKGGLRGKGGREARRRTHLLAQQLDGVLVADADGLAVEIVVGGHGGADIGIDRSLERGHIPIIQTRTRQMRNTINGMEDERRGR